MESKILEIFYSNRYTKKQIADEIAKNMKSSKVRQDLIYILDTISSEIDTDEMIPIMQEMLKYEDTKNALLSNWQILVIEFDDGQDLFDILIQDKEIKDDIKQYPEVFRDNALSEDLIKSYNLIDSIWGTDERGQDLKGELIKRILSFWDTEFIDILITKQTMRAFLKQNIDEIIEDCDKPRKLKNIVYLIDKFKEFPELKDIYNKNKFVMDLYHKAIDYIKNSKDIENSIKSISNEMIGTIIGTIIKKDKQEEIELELMDLSKGKPINFLSLGGYSLVFETNEKVFKLGAEKAKFLIEKYHKRFLYPILRKNYDNNLYVEAYEKGYNDPNITDEELLMVYEELYYAGFRWLDARKDNLVRLKNDMVLPKYVRQRDDTYSGFNQNSEEPITLKKGELAICDLDYIYYKDDPKFISGDYIDSSDDIVKEFSRKLEAAEKHKKNDDLEK